MGFIQLIQNTTLSFSVLVAYAEPSYFCQKMEMLNTYLKTSHRVWREERYLLVG